MAQAYDALPHLKPLTLASLLVELRQEKEQAADQARQAEGRQIELANDLATQTSRVAGENNIAMWDEGVDVNLFTFESRVGQAFIKALGDDEYETSNSGTDFEKVNKRTAYKYVLGRLGFDV